MRDMRLERVEIEGFRGIDRLSVDLGELTTLIGEPDCGKSSLLRAIALVLDPGASDAPAFTTADFHRAPGPGGERATSLSIALRFGAERDAEVEGGGGAEGQAADGVRLRVRAERADDDEPTTCVDVLDDAGSVVEGADGQGVLADLRRRHPAIIVGGPRRVAGGLSSAGGEPGEGFRAVVEALTEQGSVTDEELLKLRGDLLAAAGTVADQLATTPQRRLSVRDLADTPRPLVTDLSDALKPDAGRQRRVAAIWLMAAILDAFPVDGLADDAEPILLFDDIEANLHPTWLAALLSVAVNLPLQEVVATHSSEVLTWMPLRSLRRLVRTGAGNAACVEARSVRRDRYSDEDLRRLTYHLRLSRGGSFFARCWVLVEGETEAWLVPEFARLCGVEFPIEGIRTVTYAQSGVAPLLALADDLGIAWLLLADGDPAGKGYARTAREHRSRHGGGASGGGAHGDGGGGGSGGRGARQVFTLPAKDIEHYLFANGFAGVIAKAGGKSKPGNAGRTINAALRRVSKPGLALEILAAADQDNGPDVPPLMRQLVQSARKLARGQSH